MKMFLGIFFCSALFCLVTSSAFAATPSITVTPETIMQGEPVMARIEGVKSRSLIKKASFDGAAIPVFMYQGTPTALIGIDLNKKAGTYIFAVTLSDHEVITRPIIVAPRERITAPLGIPAKLGGTTNAAAKKIVAELDAERKFYNNLKTNKRTLWSAPFIAPLAGTITVTSPYGYTRRTAGYEIAHKGVDLRAPEGTPVLAMNRGIVRSVKDSITYGTTVVIDHGQGLMTYYLHLSKTEVKEGRLVAQGQEIGLSGTTGYAFAPHLHLSIKIGSASIDPMKFMALFLHTR